MNQTRWILAALCAFGVLLGWWIMGALVRSSSERPSLVARIQSLPPLGQLPNLAGGTPKLIDGLVSPGGPIWLLLESKPEAPPLLCSFPRESNGGVGAPACSSANDALAGVASRARLAEAGGAPSVLIPDSAQPHAAKALNAETGLPLNVDASATGLAVAARPGTRIVRRFQLTTLEGRPALSQVSPKEASYTGPVTGFAATHAPPAAPPSPQKAAWTCATPAGYIEARVAEPGEQPETSPALEVAFVSRGKVIAKTEGRLPKARGVVAPMACTATAAIFTWFHQGSLSTLSCSPEGCRRSSVKVEDIPQSGIVALAQAGEATIVIWRDQQKRALVRLGPLTSFTQSPTAPLWQVQGESAGNWRLVQVLPTGQSLLLLVQDLDQPAGLKALQIHADGRLESLAPQPSAQR